MTEDKYKYKTSSFDDLLGKVLTKIEVKDDAIYFTTACGNKYQMYHEQDCCEDVSIEDICGDIQLLVGEVIIEAEETTNEGNVGYGTCTWTFYKLRSKSECVTIRWYGESNGYYSESVDFEKLTKEEKVE